MSLVLSWAETLSDWLLPTHCLVCGNARRLSGSHGVCRWCWETLPQIDTSRACERCAAPLGRSFCGDCARTRFPFIRAYAFGPYDGPLKKIIHAFKFERFEFLSHPLGDLMARITSGVAATSVLAVPSTRRRNRERGFDPAVSLAERVARRLGVPRRNWLFRERDTSAQSSLHQSERFLNISGAFRASHRVSSHDVLLVDDIMTTGATLSEATSTLLRAGARSVSVCVLARTPELDIKKGLKPS